MAGLKECKQKRRDCFAYHKGCCKALKDTRFAYKCPFYKSIEAVKDEDPNYFDNNYDD